MNNTPVALELELLLNNYWILKEERPKDYYRIKNKLRDLREFSNNKLGCDIHCNNKLIKLEKIPICQGTYKIEQFDNVLDYVIFMSLLLFLEDKALDDQFILSNFTEFTTNILINTEGHVKPDWKKYKDRKSLVDVLKYASELGIIRLRDGNDSKYADDETYEALYENTGLSHYVLRNFKFDIFACQTPNDFLEAEKKELDELNYKRYIIYRGLIFYPNIVFDEISSEAVQYLKNMRYRINEDIEKYMESELIISKNTAFISEEGARERNLFPNYRKSISDIVLLVNSYVWQDETRKNEADKIIMSKLEFRSMMDTLHKENGKYFSKEYREAPLLKLIDEIVSYMKEFKLLEETEENYIFNPVTYLLKGEYPKEETKEEENYEILSFDFDND